ncbi:hypothetical protein M422DRAFT_154386 [Sphaerobolus stellatus SS14]|nr:hypothetical protein M422DRAFT_154386 [Sphaerobolus stellatus SS14]
MSFPDTVNVLVVGAGPTGLVAAITLARHEIDVIVVDAALENQNGSRATIIHARTLEVLDIIGLARPVLENGLRCETSQIRGKTQTLLRQDFTSLKKHTRFPFPILIPQDEFEEQARLRLAAQGVPIFRDKKVLAMKTALNGPGIEVFFQDGTTVIAKYVVGADGSHSAVRHQAGISFLDPKTGEAYEDPFTSIPYHLVFADVFLKEPLPSQVVRNGTSLHLDSFLYMIPLPSARSSVEQLSSKWRIAIGIDTHTRRPPQTPSLEYIQKLLDIRNPYNQPLEIEGMTSSSRYRVRAAVADAYFKRLGDDGYILLAGDAAHVHSPIGGQGMNLGICDAFALAHTIKQHIENNNDSLLQEYAESRRRIGKEIIAMTGDMTTLVYAKSGYRLLMRNLVLKLTEWFPMVSSMAAWKISGLAYREI